MISHNFIQICRVNRTGPVIPPLATALHWSRGMREVADSYGLVVGGWGGDGRVGGWWVGWGWVGAGTKKCGE